MAEASDDLDSDRNAVVRMHWCTDDWLTSEAEGQTERSGIRPRPTHRAATGAFEELE